VNTLVAQGAPHSAALTGGFHWALWVCAAIGLLAVPTTALLLRRSQTADEAPQLVPALDGGSVN
jgi:hypothetical protein